MPFLPDLLHGDRTREKPAFSIPSLVAAGALIATLFTGEALDLILSIVAIIAGLVGGIAALSPSVRGGIVSLASIVLGVLSIILSILQIIF